MRDNGKLGRRALLAGAFAGMAAFSMNAATAQDNRLTFVNTGGTSEQSIVDGYVAPFTKKTGVVVKMESPQSVGRLRAMVQSGAVTASLFELSSGELEQAVKAGLTEPLNWEQIAADPMIDAGKHAHGLGYQFFSTIMAWSKDANPVSTWAEFWDTEKNPGRRALPDYPPIVLPFALIADGVAPDKLYPLDVDRAFASLDKIKKNVVFWSAGAQAAQMLQDGEAKYSIGWSGRLVDAGPDVHYSFNQGMLDVAYIAIPKGAPNVEQANQLLREMSIAANQAVAAKVIPYAGPSPDLAKLVPEDFAKKLPTTPENAKGQFLQDAKWWGEHGAEVSERWTEWKQIQ